MRVDARLHTTGPRVWAVGDVTGSYQFSHMAESEAKTAVWNILFPFEKRARYGIAPWATFTDPELATVGMTEEELSAGAEYTVLRQPFAQDDRAITDGEGVGQVKLLASAGDRALWAHILGPRAGELIHEWILAMQKGSGVATGRPDPRLPDLSMANQHAAQRWNPASAGCSTSTSASAATRRRSRQARPASPSAQPGAYAATRLLREQR